MISSTTMTHAARVVMQGYLTASFFKEIVIDHTIQVVSESEEVSVSLVTFTVCFSTAVLLQASAKAARQFLSDDFQRVPALKDHTAGLNAPFAEGDILDAISITKAFGTPARPSSSRAVIESTEPSFEAPTKGLSTADSDTTLIADDEELAKDVFCCDRVLDVESLADESTFYEDDCQATAHCLADDEPDHTLHAGYDPQTIDNLTRRFSAISLDDVPARLSAISLDNVSPHLSSTSLDNVSSHLSPLSLDNVSSHLSVPSLDDVTSHLSTLSPDYVSYHLSIPSLDNVPSQLSTIGQHHTLHDHTIDILPDSSQHTITNLPVILPLDNGSPQSSKCQPQRTLVHDHSIDNLIKKIAALSLDEVPSQLSKLRPHHALHDHTIDALPNNTKALALDDDHTIDALPNNTKALALDDNHSDTIDALLQTPEALTLDDDHAIDNTESLTLGDDHAFDALPQKSEALTLDDNHAIDTLPDNTEALTLDDNHAINALLQNSDALTTLHDDTIYDLLQRMETLTLDDTPLYGLGPRHLRRDASYKTTLPALMLAVLSPRNLNYDSPYTTMLSTPYFDMWNLLFSTIVPHSRQNFDY
ncbi:hypothetical protein DEU56DRAFT_442332 [Suillus clintonianus]|uniref:uncharacterized protein n=1 Tax=Suillus clintonianus TaxID=1904413 RepID=UPI001B8862FA|nr:uncharacterized protein DEU56DRAFT_442332 [Suillus clintonianus]KAG2132352.1 hypothetical protein DEU56DRAFT_442332 [Suillus clintonianus]